MAFSFDPVFGDWHTERCVGTGTDGRVYIIVRKNENDVTERSVLKTIRIGDNRSENKGFNSINEPEQKSDEIYFNDIIDKITKNIEIIKLRDGGKRFVRYEEYEVRQTSDGKGIVILIRLEEMRSLTDLLSQFSFTLEETIKLGIIICKVLIRCRDAFGYIYPNLKPENVLFDKNGVCKLGDFGSFSCLDPSKTSVSYKRTEYYMAPELIKTGNINCTCDTYSLGLILYMLSNRGRLPFAEMYPQNVTVSGLDRSKESRMKDLPLPKPALSGDALFTVIKKACAFNPKDRYLSPKQMLVDLENVLENKPLEEVQYDDIYSVSSQGKADREEDVTSKVVEEYKDDYFAEVKNPNIYYDSNFNMFEKIDEQKSLKDEILIPNVSPSDYLHGEKKQMKKRRTPSVTPITKSAQSQKLASPEVKKIIAAVIAIICVIILLIVSVKTRSNNKAETTAETTTVSNVSALINLSEVTFNGS